EAMYAWMARWLQNAPADAKRAEASFSVPHLPEALVFYNRSLPSGALTADQLTAAWIDAARRQLSTTPLEVRASALRHALGFAADAAASASTPSHAERSRTVLVAGDTAAVEPLLTR